MKHPENQDTPTTNSERFKTNNLHKMTRYKNLLPLQNSETPTSTTRVVVPEDVLVLRTNLTKMTSLKNIVETKP